MNTPSTELKVLLEHKDFLIIDKPAGVPMHDPEHGILALVNNQFAVNGLKLVHRLDTPTSGCLILATHARAAAALGDLFSQNRVNKYYLALTDKKPNKKQGTISGDMINRRSGQRALLRSKNNPAITQLMSDSVEPGIRVFVAKPITGKTHQIRVAMKSIGAPIIGDDRYGGSIADRLYLHAWHIHFVYKDEDIVCYCKPEHGDFFFTESFENWVERCPNPATLDWPQTPKHAKHPA